MTSLLSIYFGLLAVLPAYALSKGSAESLAARYPNWMITADYGIVSADDLAYDEKLGGSAMPYDPGRFSNQRYWQCLPLKNVHPKYHFWSGEDGMGLGGVTVNLCDLEIEVRQPGGLQIYHDRRGHPAEFCHSFGRNWKRLTRKEDIVCLEGEGSRSDEDKKEGKYRNWTWSKLKTRKGCYAYFEGECQVAGCAKGKCHE